MGILNEIEYYCNEKNTTGALLLTGQWGCGKTYLIEQFCKNKDYKSKYIFLKISLFGESSIDNIRKRITYEYLLSLGNLQNKKKQGY